MYQLGNVIVKFDKRTTSSATETIVKFKFQSNGKIPNLKFEAKWIEITAAK